MDIEFHYYITYLIAARAGLPPADSLTLAWASQYTDDNTLICTVDKGLPTEYTNYVSQTADILKPRRTLMRIYSLFHFIPGDPQAPTAWRKDGAMHWLNTTPDSENANLILDAALAAGDLYRIGIACHAYADTWAHQNFVGYASEFNAFAGGPLLTAVMPNIGHADAVFCPDEASRRWDDPRLLHGPIDNRARFLEAADRLFRKLAPFAVPRGVPCPSPVSGCPVTVAGCPVTDPGGFRPSSAARPVPVSGIPVPNPAVCLSGIGAVAGEVPGIPGLSPDLGGLSPAEMERRAAALRDDLEKCLGSVVADASESPDAALNAALTGKFAGETGVGTRSFYSAYPALRSDAKLKALTPDISDIPPATVLPGEDAGESAVADRARQQRLARYHALAVTPSYGGLAIPPYDPDLWMDEAIKEHVRGLRDRSDFFLARLDPWPDAYTWKDRAAYRRTPWFRFQEAVKVHQNETWRLLADGNFQGLDLADL